MEGFYISIAGMMGSGKTTLARNISINLGWTLLPEGLRSRMYLNDLFSDEERWAFDTQISFLCEKAIRLKKYLASGQNVIIDRSIYEDVEVFATHFFEQKKIDSRSFSTYCELAEYFLSELPPPNLVINCECPLSEIEKRIAKRQRKIDLQYPKEHLGLIFKRYLEWSKNYSKSAFFSVDSHKNDFRNITVINKIGHEIRSVLTKESSINTQLTLPGFDEVDFSLEEPEFLKQIIPVKKSISYKNFKDSQEPQYNYPTAYIAAPFTSKASISTDKSSEPNLFISFDSSHGKIEKSPYRNMLNGISMSLKRRGFNVILPHRDINDWGRKVLPPKEVFTSCTKAVQSCDLFIGILGLSHGSHYEFGIAIGQNRPSILITTKEIEQSFISQGITSQTDKILVLKCSNFSEVPSVFNQTKVKEFLTTFFPMEDLK